MARGGRAPGETPHLTGAVVRRALMGGGCRREAQKPYWRTTTWTGLLETAGPFSLCGASCDSSSPILTSAAASLLFAHHRSEGDVMKNEHESLESLQKKYADAIAYAESLPLASSARQDAFREVGRISQQINDWHERANPTPLA